MKITQKQLRSLIGDLLSEGANPCPGAYKFANIIGDIKIEIKDTVKFVTGRAKLKPESNKLLDAIACLMNNDESLEDKNLRVEGHTDSVGGDEMNMRLSKARAKSVADYLVSAGVAKDRVASEGLGETKPIDDNDSEDGRAKNRRVEFHLEKRFKRIGPIARMPTPNPPMSSQHPDFPQALKVNEGKQLTRTGLRRLIREAMLQEARGPLHKINLRRIKKQ